MKEVLKEYYSPDYEKLWDNCTFIFDTSVLLNLYRFNDETKEIFLDVIEKIGDRKWIPYQVGYEYHNNRINVIKEINDKAEEFKSGVEKDIANIESKLKTLFERTKDVKRDRNSTLEKLEDAKKVINRSLSNSCKKAKEKFDKLNLNDDIKDKISELFDKKIGHKYSDEVLKKLYEIAADRFEKKIPPGYKDIGKDGNAKYSDYIIWKEILDYAKANSKCVVFVTADEKEDWWMINNGKKSCSPQLKKEFYDNVNKEFHMYTPERFLEEAKKYFKLRYSEDVIQEVKLVRRPIHDVIEATHTTLPNFFPKMEENELFEFRDHFLYILRNSDSKHEFMGMVRYTFDITAYLFNKYNLSEFYDNYKNENLTRSEIIKTIERLYVFLKRRKNYVDYENNERNDINDY